MIPALLRLVLASLFLFVAGWLRADSLAELPPGVALTAPEDFESKGDAALFRLEREGEERQAGERVWRMATTEAAKEPWLVQLRSGLKAEAKKGDSGLLVVRARAVETSHESDQAQFRLVVADEKKPFPRVATGWFSLDREWREIALPFAFTRDCRAGEFTAELDFGYGRQAVELAGLRVINFGAEVPLARLPRTRITYPGHEADAAWRREALERIERLRKGDLSIEVVDASGHPVPGAEVRAVLASHAFQFGTAVNVETFTKGTPDAEVYRRRIVELFNAASLENDLKWANWEGDGKPADYRARTLSTLAWLKDKGFSVRGHVMVWPGWRFLPESVKALRGQPGQARIPELVREHIRDIALATKDVVSEWDVLNEPINNHDLMDLFGREIMADWFKEAAAALPSVPLFLNDWGNHDQRASRDHVQDFEDTAYYLIEHGAPLGGLGLQGHIGGVLSAPEDLVATLDRYRKNFALPVRITEFDVNTDDEELQADYTRDFLIATFSHPSVVGVQLWGFWEGRHWEPKAALYRKDWTEKPNGAAYRKLVKETWSTDESGRTDGEGRWRTRGFYGRYDITVMVGGKVRQATVVHLADKGETLRVTLPALP